MLFRLLLFSFYCFWRQHIYPSQIQDCYICIWCDWRLQKQRGRGWAKWQHGKKKNQGTLVMDWGGWVGESGREKKVMQVTSEFSSWKIPRTMVSLLSTCNIAGSVVHSEVPHLYLDSRLVQLPPLSKRLLLPSEHLLKDLDSSRAEVRPSSKPRSSLPSFSIPALQTLTCILCRNCWNFSFTLVFSSVSALNGPEQSPIS